MGITTATLKDAFLRQLTMKDQKLTSMYQQILPVNIPSRAYTEIYLHRYHWDYAFAGIEIH